MPDAFIGTLDNEKVVNFETLNAMHFDLRTPDGKSLNLKPDKNVELSIKVDANKVDNQTYFWEHRNKGWVNISPIS